MIKNLRSDLLPTLRHTDKLAYVTVFGSISNTKPKNARMTTWHDKR